MAPEYHSMKPNVERGAVPSHPVWKEHAWILPRALFPVFLQEIYYRCFPGSTWSVGFAFPFYFICFTVFAIRAIRRFEYYASRYGTFDEKNRGRDRVPDASVGQIARGFLGFLLARTAGEFLFTWNRDQLPSINYT